MVAGVLIVLAVVFAACICFICGAAYKQKSNHCKWQIRSSNWVPVLASIGVVDQDFYVCSRRKRRKRKMRKHKKPLLCYRYFDQQPMVAYGKGVPIPKHSQVGQPALIYIDRKTGQFRATSKDRCLAASHAFAAAGGWLLLLAVVCMCCTAFQ